jgi:dienelactone hydrolase
MGRLYEPAASGRRPAILVLTGSNGGIPDHHAALLAARGYVTLALAYFRIDPLPQDLVEIPLEYFEKGIEWLRARKSVDESKLGVIGISKGGELAVLLPAYFPKTFRAAVALAPSAYVWEGGVRDPNARGLASIKPNRSSWSYRSKPLPFLPKVITPETKLRIEREGSVDTIEFYKPALDEKAAVKAARIPVERIGAAMLVISSLADRMWPSSVQAEEVCAVMRRNYGSCEHLRYEEASHLIFEPWFPVTYGVQPARPGRWDKASIGGTAEGSAMAAADSWPKILDFFAHYLGN